jgi:hypothetical protein
MMVLHYYTKQQLMRSTETLKKIMEENGEDQAEFIM